MIAVRPAQVAEAALPRRLRALRAHLENLLLRRQSRQRIARHVDELPVGRVPHLRDLQSHRAELSLYLRESGVFQPKCQTDVCGPVSSFGGGVLTFVNSR